MIEVRPEEIDDQETVYAVQAAAFGQPNEADLVVSLRRAAQPQLSLVADVAGRVVGHVFFSPVSVESSVPVPPVAGLAPLAVEPSHQGQGIGGALAGVSGAIHYHAAFAETGTA